MKILYIIDDLMIGGAERILLSLVKNLDKARFECHVASLFSAKTLGAELQHHGISCINLDLKKSNFFPTLFRLRSRIRNENYHIVQLIRPVSRLIGTLATIGMKQIKVIARYDSMISSENLKFKFFERLAVNHSDVIISPSEAVVTDITEHFSVPKFKMTVFYNGINGKLSRRQPTEYSPDKIIIGTIGNYSWKKGYSNGLKAIASVVNQFPNVTYEIIVRVDKAASINHQINELHLRNHVRLIGEVSDVTRYLHNWNIYFQPSQTEGFGFAVLEAMSCGLPIVASRVGGIPELITDQRNGLLVDPQIPEIMTNAIIELLTSPEKAKILGQNAQQTTVDKFNLTKMITDHEKLYADLTKFF